MVKIPPGKVTLLLWIILYLKLSTSFSNETLCIVCHIINTLLSTTIHIYIYTHNSRFVYKVLSVEVLTE